MAGDFVSMFSTQADSFGSVANSSEVPRVPLLDALGQRSKLVRSDHFPVTLPNNAVDAVDGAPTQLPKPKRGRFEKGPIYIDYFP